MSEMDKDIDKQKMALSSEVPPELNKENLVNFGPLTIGVHAAHVDSPKSTLRILHNANAFEFGPRDFATEGISPREFSPQSDVTMLGGLTLGFVSNFHLLFIK